MTNPFKKPKIEVAAAPKPPRRKDPAVQEARRRALVIAQSKRGILSTILSTGADLTVGGPRLLGRPAPDEPRRRRRRPPGRRDRPRQGEGRGSDRFGGSGGGFGGADDGPISV